MEEQSLVSGCCSLSRSVYTYRLRRPRLRPHHHQIYTDEQNGFWIQKSITIGTMINWRRWRGCPCPLGSVLCMNAKSSFAVIYFLFLNKWMSLSNKCTKSTVSDNISTENGLINFYHYLYQYLDQWGPIQCCQIFHHKNCMKLRTF